MSPDKKKIFMVIDGNAIVHRAYHALPPFATRGGITTGAVYGFFSMTLKLLQEIKPAYLAITFDRPKPTFRKTLYVGYQAKRPKMDDGLGDQIKIVHEILEKAKICVYEVDGFEADDVIGTIAQNSQKDDEEVYVVSGDRDMLQLVNGNVKVLAPVEGISKVLMFDGEKVREKYGIEPSQIVDYKALVGDASDNYSGVPGIGPKTAMVLIKEYDNIESVYKNIDKIEKKNPNLAKKLLDGSDMAILAKQLAKITCEVPLSFHPEDCMLEKIDAQGFIKGLEGYELNSIVKRAKDFFEGIEKSKKTQMKLL